MKSNGNLKFKEEIKENYQGYAENNGKEMKKEKFGTGALIVNASGLGARKRCRTGK